MTSIDRKTWDFGDSYYIYLSIIKEQRSDQEESEWKRQKGSQNNVNDGLCQIKWLRIVDTAMAKWASTERQRFLFMRLGKSHLQKVVVSHKGYLGCVYRQNWLQYPLCPIMNTSVNGASTIVGYVSWVILVGDRLHLVINWLLAAHIGKREGETLPAPSSKWASTECQRLLAIHHG